VIATNPRTITMVQGVGFSASKTRVVKTIPTKSLGWFDHQIEHKLQRNLAKNSAPMNSESAH
jgi:hypothetical protein